MNRDIKVILTAGFAMFTMFFGSGNLVFPLAIGVQTTSQGLLASIGLFLTGVLIPFLGLIGVILYAGNRNNFFSGIGKVPAYLIVLSMLLLLGPIGVVPRCILVGFGGIKLINPEFNFYLFNFLFCVGMLLIAWKHERIVPILGKWMTPILLGGIVALILFGLSLGPEAVESELSNAEAFQIGIVEGYQTMDLLAAFFFSATTVAYLRRMQRSDDPSSLLIKRSLYASCVGGALLGLVYIGFVLLGGKYSLILQTVGKEQYLAAIAKAALGSFALPLASLIMVVACITTGAILSMLFTDFVHDSLPKRAKIPSKALLIVTLVTSFIVARVGFSKLASWIIVALQLAYPALIALTVCKIIKRLWKRDFVQVGFWSVLLISLGNTIWN